MMLQSLNMDFIKTAQILVNTFEISQVAKEATENNEIFWDDILDTIYYEQKINLHYAKVLPGQKIHFRFVKNKQGEGPLDFA